ncbi:tetratricopeptide repeat protein [Acidobacteriota bacterium]
MTTTEGMGVSFEVGSGFTYRLIGLMPGENGPLYEAYDPETDTLFALKRLDKLDTSDRHVMARFEESIERSRSVPNLALVTPDDLFMTDKAHVLSEFIAGWNLRQHFLNPTRYQLYSQEWTVRICQVFSEICSVLGIIHDRGVTHGNLAPSNIMLSEWQDLKITDTSILMNPFQPTAADRPSIIVSKMSHIFYLAPEQLKGDEPSPEGDLYALGAMLYELLRGTPPYYDLGKEQAVRINLGRADNRSLQSVDPQADEVLSEIARKLLNADPEKRYEDANALKQAFDELHKMLSSTEAEQRAAETREVGRRVMVRSLGHGKLESSGLRGREQELNTMGSLINRVLTGEFCCMSLSGEAGIGKTRLLREGIKTAEMKLIQCYEGSGPAEHHVPYEIWKPVLEQIALELSELSSEDRNAVFPQHCLILQEICPTLGGVVGKDGDADTAGRLPSGEEAKYRMFQAMSSLLAGLGRRGPLCLIFDDLQWADDLSLELLQYIAKGAERSDGRGFGLFCAIRTGEDKSEAIQRKLDGIGLTEKIGLKKLDREAVEAMAGMMLGMEGLPSRLVDVLHEQSEGNPYFVEELLRSLKEEGVLTEPEPGVWNVDDHKLETERQRGASSREGVVPESVASAISARIDKLSEAARSVLLICAVSGAEVEFDLLEQLAQVEDEDELWDGIEEALAREILIEEGEKYSLRQHMLRSVVLSRVTEKVRQKLHIDIARFIEQSSEKESDESIIQAAHHYYEAGFQAKACLRSLDAGRIYRSRHLFDDAEKMLKRSLDITRKPGMKGDNDEDLSSIFVDATRELGTLLNQRARYDEALACYEELLALGRVKEDSRIVVDGLNGMAESLRFKGEPQRAIDALRKSLEISNTLDIKDGIARARKILGSIYLDKGEHEKAVAELEMSGNMFKEMGKEKEYADINMKIGISLFRRGEVDGALAYFRNSGGIYKRLDHSLEQSKILTNIATCLAQKDDLDEALSELERALALKEELGDKKGVASCLNNMAGIYYRLGNVKKASEITKKGILRREEINDKAGVARSLIAFSSLCLAKGEIQEAVSTLNKSMKISEELGSLELKARILDMLSSIYSSLDKHKSLGYAGQVKDLGLLSANRHIEALGYIQLARLERPAKAISTALKAKTIADELNVEDLKRNALFTLGEVLRKASKLQEASEIYNEILYELKDMIKKESPKLTPQLITDQEYLEILRKSMCLFYLSEKKSQSLFEDTILREQLGLNEDAVERLRVLLL